MLPSTLGTALAARADRVATELRAGDRDGARAQAIALRGAVVRAINAGRVAPDLQEELLAAANALVSAIPPPPPPPVEEEEKDEEKGDEEKDKGNGKDEGKGKDGGE